MASKATRIGPRKSGSKASAPSPTRSTVKAIDEKDYMAEEDARTIARASAIKADPDRMSKAAKAAQRIVEEKAAELRGFRSIARRAR